MLSKGMWVSCALALVLAACGDDGGSSDGSGGMGGSGGAGSGGAGSGGAGSGGAGSGGAGSGGSGSGGADSGGSGGAGSGGQTAPDLENDLTAEVPEITCDDGAFACRGACFTSVGEIHNRCELLAIGAEKFDGIALDDTHIYAVSPTREVLRVAKTGGTLQAIASGHEFVGAPQVADGMVYFTVYTRDPDLDNEFARVPVEGGDVELLFDPTPDIIDSGEFVLIDGYAYFLGDAIGGVSRYPLSGGPEEPIVVDTVVNYMALDATHYYFQRGFSDFDIARSPRATPDVIESLYGDSFGASIISAHTFLSPADPDNLYFIEDGLRRMPRAGGRIETLVPSRELPDGGTSIGPEYILFGNYAAAAMLHAGGDVLHLAAETSPGGWRIAEDEDYFYLADRVIFRIAKP